MGSLVVRMAPGCSMSPEQETREIVDRLIEQIDQNFAEGSHAECLALLREHKTLLLEAERDCQGWYHLRRGQVLLELGSRKDAKEALEAAFRLGGFPLFADEQEKYLAQIQSHVTRRVKTHRLLGLLLILSLPGLITAIYIIRKTLEIDKQTLSDGWIYGPWFALFIIGMIVAAYLTPYGPSED